MSILEDIRSWHLDGEDPKETIFDTIKEIQDVLFRKVRRQKKNYYHDSDFGDEETFLLYFAEEFWIRKFVPGLNMICDKEDDQSVRAFIYFLMRQFYYYEFSSQEVKELKSIVKHIRDILFENNLITLSNSILNSDTYISPVGKLPSFEKISKLFSPQFLKNPQKLQVLVIAADMIKSGVNYGDLMNELKARLMIDQASKKLGESSVDPGEYELEESDGEHSDIEEYQGEFTADEIESEKIDELSDELENFEIVDSIIDEEEFLSPEAEILCFNSEKELISAYNQKFGKYPHKRGRVEIILKLVSLRQLSVFVLTRILGGNDTPPISLEVRSKVYQILNIQSSTYYNERIVFKKNISEFGRKNKDELEIEDIRDMITDIISLYIDLNEEKGN